AAPAALQAAAPLHLELDDGRQVAWALLPHGQLVSLRLDDGRELERRELFPGREVTAVHCGPQAGSLAFGFSDGSVQLGHVEFDARRLADTELTDELRALPAGGHATLGNSLVVRGPDGALSALDLTVTLEDPITSRGGSRVELLAHVSTESQTRLSVLRAD